MYARSDSESNLGLGEAALERGGGDRNPYDDMIKRTDNPEINV